MGRFHYTNRKIEGLKLGQAVNKDLYKRIPPHVGSKAAFRDPSVDLDVSGKTLTDEGFFEIASALSDALSYDGDQGRSTRLEELCLKDNDLSTMSLQALTPIIRLAAHDLRDLDLSNNHIQISTPNEVAIWEQFLTSFEDCCTLRRLDLSGNSLGAKAFEVLLRVYAKERPVDVVLPSGSEESQNYSESGYTDHLGLSLRKVSLASEPEELAGGIGGDPTSSKRKGSKHDSKSPEKPNLGLGPHPLPVFAATHGLRSIPYLVLSKTGMTETCALHLSFIVEGHHFPEQLLTYVPPAKSGSHTQQLVAYNESQCRGIIYHPNKELGNAGLKVLELAERRRDQQRCQESEADVGPPLSPSNAAHSRRRMSAVITGTGNTAAVKRRQSTQAGDIDHDGIEAELDRARSRIQGNTLQDAGSHSNDLWEAALRLLAVGRYVSPQESHNVQPIILAAAPSVAPTVPTVPKAKAPIVKTLTIPGVSKPKVLKPLLPLATEKDPNQPVNPWKASPWNKNPWNTDVVKKCDDVPPAPKVIPPTPLSSKTEVEGSKTEVRSTKTEAESPETEAESPKAIVEKNPILSKEDIYWAKFPCGFSEAVWAKILGHLIGANGILSEGQQLSVLHYATNRNTLSKEREALGLTFATQIWRILEATGCLTYDMDI